MDGGYITASEVVLLLGIAWGPMFLIAGALQNHWLSIAGVRLWVRLFLVSILAIVQVAAAIAVWFSPANQYITAPTKLPGIFQFTSLPFQSAIPGVAVASLAIWWVARRKLLPNNSFKPTPLRGVGKAS